MILMNSDIFGVLRTFFHTLINHAQHSESYIETLHQCECGKCLLLKMSKSIMNAEKPQMHDFNGNKGLKE